MSLTFRFSANLRDSTSIVSLRETDIVSNDMTFINLKPHWCIFTDGRHPEPAFGGSCTEMAGSPRSPDLGHEPLGSLRDAAEIASDNVAHRRPILFAGWIHPLRWHGGSG